MSRRYDLTRARSSSSGETVSADGDDDGYPTLDAVNAASDATAASTTKPVGSVAQLADYLVNGFWQFDKTIAHHWSSNTLTYNIEALTSDEKALAQSALEAWHEVANVSFVQTTGAADITYKDDGTLTASEQFLQQVRDHEFGNGRHQL